MLRSGSTSMYQRGASLIELMIGITIGLILLAGVVVTVVNTNNSGMANIQTTRLNQEMRENMDFMHRELQRSGYVDAWDADDDGDPDEVGEGDASGAVNLKDLNLVAMEAFSKVTILNATGTTPCANGSACECVLYSYDRDGDGTQDANEFYGFKRALVSGNGVIQVKTSGASTDDDCGDGNWTTLTSDGVNITTLTFAIDTADSTFFDEIDDDDVESAKVATSCTTTPCIQRRKINITLTASSTSNLTAAGGNLATLTLNDQVKLMNDYYDG